MNKTIKKTKKKDVTLADRKSSSVRPRQWKKRGSSMLSAYSKQGEHVIKMSTEIKDDKTKRRKKRKEEKDEKDEKEKNGEKGEKEGGFFYPTTSWPVDSRFSLAVPN